MSWTPERMQTAKAMWIAGRSATEIANHLGGLTRNAVIGKVHRMGLMRSERTARKAPAAPKRIKEAKLASAPKRKKSGAGPMGSLEGHRPNVIKGVQGAQPSQKVVPIESAIKARLRAAESANAGARRVPIMELERGQCRWPVNDAARGDEHLFCGAPAIPGKSYCAAHAAIAYRPGGEARSCKSDDRTQAARVLDGAEAVRRRQGVA
jgi:GcrA cell cycle regulator